MLICKKHSPYQIVFVCLKANCTMGNLLCQQCLTTNPQHRQEHRSYFNSINEFLSLQNGNTKTQFIPQINEMLNELERKLKDYSAILEKEIKEIDQDVAQIFKIFFETSERAKQQIKDIIRKDLAESHIKLSQFRQFLQEMSAQKKQDGNNLFNAIFSRDQEKELPVTEQSLLQIINKNSSLNKLKSDIIITITSIQNSMTTSRPKYKATTSQQQQFQLIKSDFLQALNCLYSKLADLTQENQSVEDMKRSIYQFNSVDVNNNSANNSIMRQSSMSQSQCSNSSRFVRNSSTIISFKPLEAFPNLPQNINDILGKIGHLPTPTNDSLLNNLESVSVCQFPDGIIYEGQIQNNMKHGWGRAIIGQDYYEGYWRNNLPYGFGRIIIGNGQYYEGMSMNGKASGKGILISGGYSYDGEWEDDQKHGKGTETMNGQFSYEGNFEMNQKNGVGKFHDLITGNIFSGDFKDDMLIGQATIEYCNGDKYWGEVTTINGEVLRNGRGIYLWHDGRKYEGSYIDDQENGEGIFIWPDQWIYNGQWQQGVQHGKGLQISPQGKEREGIWINGYFKQWVS